jgi:hypothetical protein
MFNHAQYQEMEYRDEKIRSLIEDFSLCHPLPVAAERYC